MIQEKVKLLLIFSCIIVMIRWLEGGKDMINFEEEIEKFQPSLEVDEAEDAIYNNDVTDVTDIIQDILSEMKKN